MIRRFAILAALAWTGAMAQSKWPNELTVTFGNGTQLRVHTESSMARAPLSTTGTVALGDGSNSSHRLVLDPDRRVLFGYTIDAWRVPNTQDLYFVRIKPLDPAYEARLPKDSIVRKKPPVSPDGKIVTVASVRDFPNVRKGEAVSIDILVNPATGERIYDVLEPTTAFEEMPHPPKPYQGDSFSLQRARIVVNGKVVRNPDNGWIIGSAARIAIPGYGMYYLALEPVPGYNFLPTGRANKEVLSFGEGNDWVEVTGTSNVLTKSEFRTVWVYHVPTGGPASGVEIWTADSISSLLPKPKKGGEE